MKQLTIFLCLILLQCSSQPKSDSQHQVSQTTTNMPNVDFDPKNTYILMVGVLSWQDPNLSSFESKNRKDQALYDLFKTLGVPTENMMILLDQEATLENIKQQLTDLASKTNSQSTFLFYYAGHGTKLKNGEAFFCNYDYVSGKEASKGLNVSMISEVLNANFKGSTIWLSADCCYSGALIEQATQLKVEQVVVATSASSSNISTGNWTFTQTLIDCFAGLHLADHNQNGTISLGELKTEIANAMKYREKQLFGFYLKGIKEGYNLAQTQQKKQPNLQGDFKLGDYAIALDKQKWYPVRIIDTDEQELVCEFYFYSDKVVKNIPKKQLKPLHFVNYPVGQELEVLWEGQYYKAKVLKNENGFHYITYPNYASYYDEWVMYDRIRTGNEKKVAVEYKGQWYPAIILEEANNQYFIHYTHYDYYWDEWVDKSRVK
jgi:hypothetical protein